MKTKKAFILTLALSVAAIFLSGRALADEGAKNLVLVKDLDARYDVGDGIISGKAVIGNFGNRSFHNLSYVAQLWAYAEGSSLGVVVDESYNQREFFLSSGGEIIKNFSYQIPDGVPSGKYNFVFQVIDSKGRELGFDFYPFEYKNNSGLPVIEVIEDSIKIEINKADHPWGIGAPAGSEDEVRLKFEIVNENNFPIDGIEAYLSVYPYTTKTENIKEQFIENFSLKASERKAMDYKMPSMPTSQSYTAIVNFKKDGKPISLPVRGRWVTEGTQGKIFSSGLGDDGTLVVDIVGSPYSNGKSGELSVNVIDEAGKICLTVDRQLENVGETGKVVSIPVSFDRECKNPVVNAKLEIDGKSVDNYSSAIVEMAGKETTGGRVEEKENDKAKWFLVALVIFIFIIIVLVMVVMAKKMKNKSNLIIIFFIAGGISLSAFLSFQGKAKAWIADTGNYSEWIPTAFFSEQNLLKNQKECLEEKNNFCHKFEMLTDYRDINHEFYFEEMGWTSPYHGEIFSDKDKIRINLTNIHSWCSDNVHFPIEVNYGIFPRGEGLTDSEPVKEGSFLVSENTRISSRNIGSLPIGQYAVYLSLYALDHPENNFNLLFQGMARYVIVEGCGDGIVQDGEECDWGASNGVCPSFCDERCLKNNCPRVIYPQLSARKVGDTDWQKEKLEVEASDNKNVSLKAEVIDGDYVLGENFQYDFYCSETASTPDRTVTSAQAVVIAEGVCGYANFGDFNPRVIVTQGLSQGEDDTLVSVYRDGKCGPAAGTYSASDTKFNGELCSVGSPEPTVLDFPDINETVKWNCSGENGGLPVSCLATRLKLPCGCGPAASGSFCNSIPKADLCKAGLTPSPVARTENGWSWKCSGADCSESDCFATQSCSGREVNP